MPSPVSLFRTIAGLFRPAEKTSPPSDVGDAGRSGTTATIEIDPQWIGPVRTTYTPSMDGAADPGEIVWTWVPYVERDGRGKDRPVLVVAAETTGTVLAVQLTSQQHPGRPEYVPVGAGTWDVLRRPSFVDVTRVFRLHQGGMRREAAALDAAHYATVRSVLQSRYGWA